MGKVKRLELWRQLYRTSLPVWDLENFRPMDICWHECTVNFPESLEAWDLLKRVRGMSRTDDVSIDRRASMQHSSCQYTGSVLHCTTVRKPSILFGHKKCTQRYSHHTVITRTWFTHKALFINILFCANCSERQYGCEFIRKQEPSAWDQNKEKVQDQPYWPRLSNGFTVLIYK